MAAKIDRIELKRDNTSTFADSPFKHHQFGTSPIRTGANGLQTGSAYSLVLWVIAREIRPEMQTRRRVPKPIDPRLASVLTEKPFENRGGITFGLI